MEAEVKKIIESLKPMFREAKSKKLWFYTSYQQIWFSPEELKAENKCGRFLWGAGNWELRDPIEGLQALDKKIENAQSDRDRFAARLRRSVYL
jgi:hypothetical protein